MAKCTNCNSCLEYKEANGIIYLYCFLCQKFFIPNKRPLTEVSKEEIFKDEQPTSDDSR